MSALKQYIFITAPSRSQADRECREAGIAPTHHNPRVRYIFTPDQLRGIERGFILCMLGRWSASKSAGDIGEMAASREARIFYSLAEAIQAASKDAP